MTKEKPFSATFELEKETKKHGALCRGSGGPAAGRGDGVYR
jgi:hypothetical protein